MGLFCVTASTSMPACAAFLLSTAADMTDASSSSVAPPRTASRKLTSLAPNRHTCSSTTHVHPPYNVGTLVSAVRAAAVLPTQRRYTLRLPSMAPDMLHEHACCTFKPQCAKGLGGPTLNHTCFAHPMMCTINAATGTSAQSDLYLTMPLLLAAWQRRHGPCCHTSRTKAANSGGFIPHLQCSISQQPESVAVPAEGVCHAGDEAHTALEARHTEVLGHLASRVSMAHKTLGEPAGHK